MQEVLSGGFTRQYKNIKISITKYQSPILQDKSPKSAKKKKSAKTPPAKSPNVDSPVIAEKIKIKLKLTPNKADSKNLANFDFDVNSSK